MRLVRRREQHSGDEPHPAAAPPVQAYPSEDDARTALDRLVEDVQQLRLEISSDLTVAAAAVELDAPDFAADLVERDRRELKALSTRASDRLAALDGLRLGERLTSPPTRGRPPSRGRRGSRPARREPARTLRLRVAAVPVALAVGAVALMMSGTLSGVRSQHRIAASPVAASWQHFAEAATAHRDASSVIAAATQLHQSLSTLIATARTNPQHAQQVLRLLELERTVLVENQPDGAAVVLHDVATLAQELRAMVPSVVVPVALINPVLPSHPHPRHTSVVALPTSQPQQSANAHGPQTGTSPKPAQRTHPSTKPSMTTHTTAPTPAPSTAPQSSNGPTPPPWQPFPTHSSLFD